MVNLLKETIDKLAENGKSPSDVKWVGNFVAEEAGSWDEFANLVADFDYDNGFGGNIVALQLVVVGEDWWLERGGYDRSEWWKFKQLPQRKPEPSPLTMVTITEGW